MKRPALGHILGYTALTVILTAGAAQSLAGSNTVTSDDISDGTITSADIKDQGILYADIKDGAMTGKKLLDGSVTSADIANGTVAAADIQPGTIPDLDSIEVVTVTADPPAGSTFGASAPCPSGKRAIAGGGTINDNNVRLLESTLVNGTTWRLTWISTTGGNIDPTETVAHVTCMPFPD